MYELICNKKIKSLKQEAITSNQKRSRLCLHTSHSHLTQESIICALKENYFRPHKHPEHISESYSIIEGQMQIDFFNDSGDWIERVILGEIKSRFSFLYRLNQSVYHWVRPLSDILVYHEVLTGPWEKQKVVHYADFSPIESDESGIIHFTNLYNLEAIPKDETA